MYYISEKFYYQVKSTYNNSAFEIDTAERPESIAYNLSLLPELYGKPLID